MLEIISMQLSSARYDNRLPTNWRVFHLLYFVERCSISLSRTQLSGRSFFLDVATIRLVELQRIKQRKKPRKKSEHISGACRCVESTERDVTWSSLIFLFECALHFFFHSVLHAPTILLLCFRFSPSLATWSAYGRIMIYNISTMATTVVRPVCLSGYTAPECAWRMGSGQCCDSISLFSISLVMIIESY